MADMMVAGARLHLGRISEANEQFAEMIAAHDAESTPAAFRESQGWDFAAHTRAWQAHALWCLGYPAAGVGAWLDDAVRLANDLDQPFNQALVSAYVANAATTVCRRGSRTGAR